MIEELRHRPQWLLWDSDASSPRQPHWRGDFSISWSDPNDWHTYDEAVEAAQEQESWGIGYVFAVDNPYYDDGKYGFLDLDGCLTEPRDIESLKDWVPPLNGLLDGYTEYSAGEFGLHAPVIGSQPDWWSNPDENGHEGPEFHTNKFCALTGDTVEGTGNGIEFDDLEPFLLGLYQNWHDEYPPIPSIHDGLEDRKTDYGDREEWLTDDDIEDALTFIDPDLGRREWWNIGRAIQDFDDGDTGKQLYTEWSQTGEKWDDDADYLLDWLWSRSTPGDGTTLGTLIHHATENGWEMPESPDGSGSQEQVGDTSMYLRNGRLGYWRQDSDDNWIFDEAINFEIDLDTKLSTSNRLTWNLTIDPVSEPAYEVQVEPIAFNEARSFKNEIVIGNTTTLRLPRPKATILSDLRTYVGTQDAPKRIGVEKIGLHGDEFVTPNGVLDSNSWTDEPKHVFIDQGVAFTDTWQLTPGGHADHNDIADILTLLPQTRDLDRFLPVLGWFYATPLRPLIMNWEREFNHLAVFGDTRSGKTGTLGVMLRLFGMTDDPVNGLDSEFTRLATLSVSNSVPVWMDEYKPSEMYQGARNKLHRDLRRASGGDMAQRGRPDQSTDGYHLSAPVILSGEQLIQGAAERRRSIMSHFKNGTTDPNTDTRRAFHELIGSSYMDGDTQVIPDGHDFEAHAQEYITWLLGHDEQSLKEIWNNAEKAIQQYCTGLGDFEQQGLQTVAFGYSLYMNFATNHIGVQASELPSRDDLYSALDYLSDGRDQPTESTLDTFVSYLAKAALDSGYLKLDQHYTFVNQGKPNEELRINFNRAIDKVHQYVNSHGIDARLSNDYKTYISLAKEQADSETGYISGTSIRTRGLGRCVGIDTSQASELVDGFDRRMFTKDIRLALEDDDDPAEIIIDMLADTTVNEEHVRTVISHESGATESEVQTWIDDLVSDGQIVRDDDLLSGV